MNLRFEMYPVNVVALPVALEPIAGKKVVEPLLTAPVPKPVFVATWIPFKNILAVPPVRAKTTWLQAFSGGAATTTVTKTLYDLPIDFETPDVDLFAPYGSPISQFDRVNNPNATGLNTSSKVGMFTKGGTTSGTISLLNIPVNFAYGKKIKVMVYNPNPANIGKNVTLLLQGAIVPGQPANGVAIKKVPITTSGVWEQIVFDYGTISAIPAGAKFGQLILRFNDTQAGAQEVLYVDNFILTN